MTYGLVTPAYLILIYYIIPDPDIYFSASTSKCIARSNVPNILIFGKTTIKKLFFCLESDT